MTDFILQSNRGTLPVVALVASLALSACGLDERSLTERSVYTSGPPGMADGSAGESGVDVGTQPVPSCDYSSGAVDPACESLVANPGFHKSIEGWALEPRAVQARWDILDAAEAKKSGSLIVTNALSGDDDGASPGGVFQCFKVEPGQHFQYAADLLIPEGQGRGIGGGAYVGRAALSLFMYNNGECEIPTVGNVTSELIEAAGEWQHISGQSEIPAEIHSVAYRLIAIKPHLEDPFDVHFDNVLARVY